MLQPESTTVRLKVSPELARIVKPGAPRDVQLAAARGALPLNGKDLLLVLFFLCGGQDLEIKRAALATLRELPVTILTQVVKDPELYPQLLDLLAKVRLSDVDLMAQIILHPATSLKTILFLAMKAPAEVLERLVGHQNLLYKNPELVEAIIANPAAEKSLKFKLGWLEPLPEDVADSDQETPSEEISADDEVVDENEGRSQTEIEKLMQEADREGLSKYQIALELKVSEKIKMGMTGDKEWRSIMIKQANKLIQGAVLKNPRITDGEVLMIAKNKASSDDMIRIILLNKDWLKNYDIKKALVTHPKTPAPKALRFVSALSTKDIKDISRSRQVSNIVASSARKELEMRMKKMGV